MGARIGLIDGLLAAATATFRCNRQGLDPAGRRRLTRTVAQNGTFRSSSITLKIPSLKVVSRMCRPLLTTPFTGPIVWWFWMEDCQTWHIFSYSSQKRSSSNWQRNIGRKRVNGSGSLRRPPTRLAKSIRAGEYTLPNLETIVRWKSERMVHYLIGNSSESIESGAGGGGFTESLDRGCRQCAGVRCAALTSRSPRRF